MNKYNLLLTLLFSMVAVPHERVEELQIKSINQVVDIIFPDDKIWRINGNSIIGYNFTKKNISITVDFYPFISSKNYCRYSSMYFETPGWEGDESDKSYNVVANKYIGLKLNKKTKCTDVDYFLVIGVLSDSRVTNSLNELKKISFQRMGNKVTNSNIECFTKRNIGKYLKSIIYSEEDRSLEFKLKVCDSKMKNTQIIVTLDYSNYKSVAYDVDIKEVTNDGITDLH